MNPSDPDRFGAPLARQDSSGYLSPSPSLINSSSASLVNSGTLTRLRHAVTHGYFRAVCSGDLKVGHIVKVLKNQMVPCDMILLGTSEEKGHCFIDKSNLNGETTLEVFSSPAPLRRFAGAREGHNGTGLLDLAANLSYEQPSSNMERFRCRMSVCHAAALLQRQQPQSQLQSQQQEQQQGGGGASGASSADAAAAVSVAGKGCNTLHVAT